MATSSARKPAAPGTPAPATPAVAAPKAPAVRKRPVKAPAAKTAATPAKPAKPAAAAAPKAPKKPKLVRDSFTIPKPEYLVIDALKERATKLGQAAKKSEVLRAGIKALAAMDDTAFAAALAAVPTIKTGRPKSAV